MYLQQNLWKSTKICHKVPVFLKAPSRSLESQAQMFHIQVWKLFCALCKLPWASVHAEGWCTKCAAHGSDKCFLKTWHLRASIQCERTDTAFFAYKRKKKRPFQGNSMSTLYPDVYEPGTQVGSVFGYHWVKTESWQAPWELLLTQYILNWLIKKNLYSKAILFSSRSLSWTVFYMCSSAHQKRSGKYPTAALVFPDSRRELISCRKWQQKELLLISLKLKETGNIEVHSFALVTNNYK